MAGKVIQSLDEVVIGDRLVVLTAEQILRLPTEDYNKAGVVLIGQAGRVKAFVKDADGVPVEVVVSLYVQRAPVNDNEREAVATVAAERKATAAEKKADEQNRLAREKQAAFELGNEAAFRALRNVNELAQAASALNKLAAK